MSDRSVNMCILARELAPLADAAVPHKLHSVTVVLRSVGTHIAHLVTRVTVVRSLSSFRKPNSCSGAVSRLIMFSSFFLLCVIVIIYSLTT